MSETAPTQTAYAAIQSVITGTVRLSLSDIKRFHCLMANAPAEKGVWLTRAMRKNLRTQMKQMAQTHAFRTLHRLKTMSVPATADSIAEDIATTKGLFSYAFDEPAKVKGLHIQTQQAGQKAALAAAQEWINALSTSDAASYTIQTLQQKTRKAAHLLRMAKDLTHEKRNLLVAVYRKACGQCRDARVERMTKVTWYDTPEKLAAERALIQTLHRGSRQKSLAFENTMQRAHMEAAQRAVAEIRTAATIPPRGGNNGMILAPDLNTWASVTAAHLNFVPEGPAREKLMGLVVQHKDTPTLTVQ